MFFQRGRNMWGGSLGLPILFYLTGKWFSREVEDKWEAKFLLSA